MSVAAPPRPRDLAVREALGHLVEASKEIISTLDPNRLLEVLMDRAIKLTAAKRGFLMLADDDNVLRFRAGRYFDQSQVDGGDAQISRSVADEVFRTGKAILSANVLGDDALRNRESVLALRLQTVMCAPIIAKERILGVLYVDSNRIRRSFDPAGLEVFQALTDLAAVALENARLYELATTDTKTGLANVGVLRSRLDEALEQARTRDDRYGLILVDLDHFKRVNDDFGHLAGDAVLREVAQICLKTVRSGDIAARFGGEEFALLLGPAPADQRVTDFVAVAERVRERVASTKLTLDGRDLSVTASFGVAELPNPGISTADDLIEMADRALYEAKRTGRNRVVAASPSPA